MATKSTALKCTTVGLMNAFIAARSFSVKTLVPIETATNMRPTKVAAAVPIKRSKSCQASRWSALANVERNEWGGFWFQQNGNRSNVSWDGGSGGSGAAAGSSSGCECDDAVLRIGDPRTSGYRLLSGGIRRLPAASTLVSARLGIDGALSLRHLCLWTCLLSSSLLPLSCSLPAPARVRSRRTAGSSPAISAPRLVVVKMGSCLRRGASSTAAPPGSEPLPPTLRWPSGAAFGPPLGNLICELGDVGFDDLHSPRLRALFGFPHRGINVAQSRNLLAGDATGRCLYEIVNDA